MQKERFKRPEPGFSMYEGRTRGKRIKYTYSDEEDMTFSDSTNRRSARNTGTSTPVETGPVTTSSGRQIKAPSRLNVATGDSAPNSVQGDDPEFEEGDSVGPASRPRRSAAAAQASTDLSHAESRSRRNTSAGSEEESDAEFGDDEEDADEHVPEESEDEDEFDEDEAMVDDDLDEQPHSLVVKLSVTPPKLQTALSPTDETSIARAVTPSKEPATASVSTAAPETRLIDMKDVSHDKDTPRFEPVATTAAQEADSTTVDPGAHESKSDEKSVGRPQTPEPVGLGEPLSEKAANLSAAPATALAFRGSPEKPQEHSAAPPRDVVDHE